MAQQRWASLAEEGFKDLSHKKKGSCASAPAASFLRIPYHSLQTRPPEDGGLRIIIGHIDLSVRLFIFEADEFIGEGLLIMDYYYLGPLWFPNDDRSPPWKMDSLRLCKFIGVLLNGLSDVLIQLIYADLHYSILYQQ